MNNDSRDMFISYMVMCWQIAFHTNRLKCDEILKLQSDNKENTTQNLGHYLVQSLWGFNWQWFFRNVNLL